MALALTCVSVWRRPTSAAAQQEAERAKYVVLKARQDKKSIIIKAQGEAKSAEMIGTPPSRPGAQRVQLLCTRSPARGLTRASMRHPCGSRACR